MREPGNVLQSSLQPYLLVRHFAEEMESQESALRQLHVDDLHMSSRGDSAGLAHGHLPLINCVI